MLIGNNYKTQTELSGITKKLKHKQLKTGYIRFYYFVISNLLNEISCKFFRTRIFSSLNIGRR
jgi:hypothetical protein